MPVAYFPFGVYFMFWTLSAVFQLTSPFSFNRQTLKLLKALSFNKKNIFCQQRTAHKCKIVCLVGFCENGKLPKISLIRDMSRSRQPEPLSGLCSEFWSENNIECYIQSTHTWFAKLITCICISATCICAEKFAVLQCSVVI
jgi:hypothetical protein